MTVLTSQVKTHAEPYRQNRAVQERAVALLRERLERVQSGGAPGTCPHGPA